jgi:hypothetical protein
MILMGVEIIVQNQSMRCSLRIFLVDPIVVETIRSLKGGVL